MEIEILGGGGEKSRAEIDEGDNSLPPGPGGGGREGVEAEPCKFFFDAMGDFLLR